MGVVRCFECGTLIDLDENLDDFDFETETCRRCIESKQCIEREEE
jgi:DNA-directed RNA polymerase subunit N (RpoN/RPB10)